MPGARHSVTDGLSGFIHRAGDLESFVAACFRFIEEPERIAKMGLAARQEAERRYEIGLRTGQQADLILDPARIS